MRLSQPAGNFSQACNKRNLLITIHAGRCDVSDVSDVSSWLLRGSTAANYAKIYIPGFRRQILKGMHSPVNRATSAFIIYQLQTDWRCNLRRFPLNRQRQSQAIQRKKNSLISGDTWTIRVSMITMWNGWLTLWSSESENQILTNFFMIHCSSSRSDKKSIKN